MKKKKVRLSRNKYTLIVQRIPLFDDTELFDEGYDSSLSEAKLDKFIESFFSGKYRKLYDGK